MTHWTGKEAFGAFLVLGAAFLAGGCATAGYYGQAVSGQMEIWRKQVPIDEVDDRKIDDAEIRRKLALIRELCAFAEDDLGLPAGDDYTKYADLGRDHVVWNVFAAPALSLEPKTFWYPVVGSLSYRGFFNEADAEAFAAKLRSKGFDVYVGGVDAYSTLGWFSDPVLNTFMHYDDIDLAELVFHELTHQRVFVPGETAFNEAMATAVAEEGTRRWLVAKGDDAGLVEYRERLQRQADVYSEITAVRVELAELYQSAGSETDKLAMKKVQLLDFQKRLGALSESWGKSMRKAWLDNLPNNALLNATATYYQYVPLFAALIEEEGGNLDLFFEQVEGVDVPVFLGTGA